MSLKTKIALSYLPTIVARYRDWEEEAESYRREGYRPRTCQHGTYMWVDYDCACGQCEEGIDLLRDRHRIALDWAAETIADYERRLQALTALPHDVPTPVRDAMVQWCVEALPAL